MVLWLIGALAALHAWRVMRPDGDADSIVYQFGLYPMRYSHAFLESRMANPGTLWERAVPFISYMGLHNDWVHLTINCFFLLAFGPIVARRWGPALFLIFFTLCGVASALTYLACNWASPIPVVGASGAISGLMPAALRLLPGQAPWAAQADVPPAPLLSRPLMMFTVFFIAINVLTGLTGWGFGGENGLIAWQAHLGGYAAGLLLSGPFDILRPRSTGAPVDR